MATLRVNIIVKRIFNFIYDVFSNYAQRLGYA
jgi:hypothetical protein